MVLGDVTPPRLGYEAALALHRAGKLGQARAAYERLLEGAESDPDLLGLLGVVALQQGRAGEAESLLRRAIAAGGAARAQLRNLNNLIALLRETGRRAEAQELVAQGVPDWPDEHPPDAVERETVLSLGRALLALNSPEFGLRLIRSAFAASGEDPEVQALTGRLLLALGQPAAALGELQPAALACPGDFDLQVALNQTLKRLGHRDAAREALN